MAKSSREPQQAKCPDTVLGNTSRQLYNTREWPTEDSIRTSDRKDVKDDGEASATETGGHRGCMLSL